MKGELCVAFKAQKLYVKNDVNTNYILLCPEITEKYFSEAKPVGCKYRLYLLLTVKITSNQLLTSDI